MTLNHTSIGEAEVQLVFLHGLFGQGKNWNTIARGLTGTATSHLVDLPNHGQSPWSVEFSLDNQADIVADWLSETFSNPVALVGHSLGGKIAMRLTLRHPELVERLLVSDISPARNPATADFSSYVAAMRQLRLEGLESRTQADQQMSTLVEDPVVRGFLLQNLRRRAGEWVWSCNLDLLGDNLHTIGGWPPIEGTYQGIVYWISGSRSQYVQPEHAEPMRELFPKVISATLKDAGHWVHADQPEAFTSTVKHFLAAGRD